MRITVNLRDRSWWAGMAAALVMLAVALLFFVAGVRLKTPGVAAVGGAGAALFGAIVYGLARPSLHVSMQMTREMSYRELKAAIAAEDFAELAPMLDASLGSEGVWCPGLKDRGKRRLCLLSENWLVAGIAESPIYVPKSKIAKIEVIDQPVVFASAGARDDAGILRADGGSAGDAGAAGHGNGAAACAGFGAAGSNGGRGEPRRRTYYVVRFVCDAKHSFDSGLFAPEDIGAVGRALTRHFPHVELSL